jgi:acyl-coenzyme A thioesterase PaaI-like protein
MGGEDHYGDGGDVFERVRTMMQWTPQGRALGFEVTKLEGNHVWGRAPYKQELIGDPETGVIAGGVITTFLDQLCGMAAVLAMKAPSIVATIDMLQDRPQRRLRARCRLRGQRRQSNRARDLDLHGQPAAQGWREPAGEEDVSAHASRPPPIGGGGACRARDGGVGAASCKGSAIPLSQRLRADSSPCRGSTGFPQ